MKKILMILTITAFCSCESNEEKSYNYIDAGDVDFSIFNAQGEDLLDPKTPNHINDYEIKLFYLIDGVKKEIHNGLLVNPKNFVIHKNENETEYHIVIFLNELDKSDKTTTYIQWNEKDTDTINATFFKNKDLIFTKDVWFNGKLVFTSTFPDNTPRVKLIK